MATLPRRLETDQSPPAVPTRRAPRGPARTQPPTGPYRFTIKQYERMTRHGILDEHDPVVLIDGALVRKIPRNEPHVAATRRALRALQHLDLAGWLVCKEDPIVLPKGREGRESVPEPDLSVLRGDIEDYDRRKPGPADVGLIVEVADTSVRKDRGMLLRYAHANVPTTWLIDLNTRVVEVHTDPTGPAKRPRYRKVARFADNETVPVVLDGLEVGRVAVRDLLP